MRAKKFFGQHFLRDKQVIEAIIEAADVSGMSVLEIGPGEGVVTEALARQAKRVVAVDIDEEAIASTRHRNLGSHVELICEDVLHPAGDDIRRRFVNTGFVLVGNLPYNITSDLLRWMLCEPPRPLRAVVMIQAEVGERIMARAGDMSLLGLMVQLYAKVVMITRVPPGAFSPPPQVDSVVVRLDPYRDEEMRARGVSDAEKVLRFARVAFNGKRKQLASTLGTLPTLSPEHIKAALATIKHLPTARPQELSTKDWIAFYNVLHP